MSKVKERFLRYSCVLLCLVLFFTLLPVSALAEQPSSKVVRVGWYEDAYNITGKNGERSGYGYEYEQSVAAYTGWTYEYVKAGWSDLLQMMENGEIDLMAGISYTDERAEKMLFSELPMGHEKYYLYADLKHTDISASDLNTLNGKRVALMRTSVQATQFYDWEASHNLHLQYVDANSFEQGLQQAADREIDCVISTETPAWVEFGMSAIAITGGSDIYFAISKDRPDLKEELDSAMRTMESDKPFYADELYQRYLSAVSSPVLSSEEENWLEEHGDIRIGFLKDDGGISRYDPATSKLTGVITDYVQFARDCLDNHTLEFNLVGYDTLGEEIQALKNGDIDLIFHFTQNPYVAEQNGFVLSNTILSSNMVAITSESYFNEATATTAAVQKDDMQTKWYISYCYPEWNIVECDTAADVERAVLNGQADCLLAESGELDKYSDNKKLHSVFLMQPGNTAFALKLGSSTLMSILNKTLLTIPSSMLTGALSMYESEAQKVTLADFIKDNLLAVAMLTIAVFLLILLLILSFLKKSQRAEAKALDAAKKAQELNQQLKESQSALETALLQAENASRAKTDFLSNMSHDIRTPMNAIIGITALMKNEMGEPEKLQEHLEKLESSGRHLLGIINDILDMNRIESGQTSLNIVSVNLADQLAQVDSMIRPQAAARRQCLTFFTTHLRHENVMCDPTRLSQVLVNILSNAVKYTPTGGHISLEVEEIPRTGHYLKYKFIVKDDGIGMNKEFIQHLYDPFTRAESSMTSRVQGTGLGMAITKSVVDLMGGVIHVDSVPGRGTRFEVTLEFPIDANADESREQLSILLLGCGPENYQRIKDATEGRPVLLQAVPHIEDALSAVRQTCFDVVLLSSAIPPEMVQQLRSAAQPDIILLGISPAASDAAELSLANTGLDGYLPLPFFLSNLETELTRIREARTSTAPQAEASPLQGMKFLCAEDNDLNAEILRMLLEMQGASCTIYSDGKQLVDAFARVQPGEYDMILMDIQMPVMDGLDAARAIRRGENPLGKTIPILAMTANAFVEDIEKSRSAGMDAHLSKPVDIHMLEQTVRKFRVTPPPKLNDEMRYSR